MLENLRWPVLTQLPPNRVERPATDITPGLRARAPLDPLPQVRPVGRYRCVHDSSLPQAASSPDRIAPTRRRPATSPGTRRHQGSEEPSRRCTQNWQVEDTTISSGLTQTRWVLRPAADARIQGRCITMHAAIGEPFMIVARIGPYLAETGHDHGPCLAFGRCRQSVARFYPGQRITMQLGQARRRPLFGMSARHVASTPTLDRPDLCQPDRCRLGKRPGRMYMHCALGMNAASAADRAGPRVRREMLLQLGLILVIASRVRAPRG